MKNKRFHDSVSLQLMMSGLVTGLKRGYLSRAVFLIKPMRGMFIVIPSAQTKADAGKVLGEGAGGQGQGCMRVRRGMRSKAGLPIAEREM